MTVRFFTPTNYLILMVKYMGFVVEHIKSTSERDEYEQFIMNAEIKLPTLEVTGIACMNMQFDTATPPVWKEGEI